MNLNQISEHSFPFNHWEISNCLDEETLNEIIEETKKIKLKKKIEVLENKVSLNLDQNLYSELLSLRNQLKSG